jgi:hypothetical protein
MEERSFHWTVVDERHTAKSADWFWAVGLITITICISAIFLEDILFAVLIFIAGGIFIYNALQGPRTTKCEINKRGIIMNGYLYPYENIESFCFEIDSLNFFMLSFSIFLPFYLFFDELITHPTLLSFYFVGLASPNYFLNSL